MATTATVDGEAVAVTYVSPTEVQITTPPGDAAGAVDITVTTSAGSATLPGAFTYEAA